MSSAGGTKDILQQVNQFWSMLDDLSQNDAAGYRKFIEKQMKTGADLTAPPELHARVRTDVLERLINISKAQIHQLQPQIPNELKRRCRGCISINLAPVLEYLTAEILELEPEPGLLYINICSWKRVPAPRNPHDALPMCGGKLERGIVEGQGWCAVLDVALNPAVLQESKEDKVGITSVCKLALSFAQQQHGVQLSPDYSVVNFSPNSSPDDLYSRLGFQMRRSTFKQPETANQTPASLLLQMSSQQADKQDEDSAARVICGPTEDIKKNLIQVMSTTCAEPQKPEYQLELKTDSAGVPRSVELTVELPKVRSVSECQLQVSEEDVLLEVEDVYYLLLELPKTVNEDTASAIFNKKKRRLTLTMDVL